MGRRGRPPFPDILTPREWEVLALLRENLTNEAIAARLGVTHAAAKYHVSEILSKLGVATREEAAAWEPGSAEAGKPRLRRWGLGLVGWLRPVTLGKAALVGASVVVLAGMGVLAWGVLRSGTPSERPGPTPSAAVSDFPPGFVELSRGVNDALATADVGFFGKRLLFQDWDCGTQSLPAAGPQCAPASPGTGELGIDIGTDGSEGAIYDAASAARTLFDWLHAVPSDGGSDAYGPGFPRVWAIAKAAPGSFGAQAGEDLYAIIATKIWPATEVAPANRTVLTLFVTAGSDTWLISHLLHSRAYFLDPRNADTQRLFPRYALWADILGPGEPTPAWSPRSGWESPRSVRKIAFLDSSARLWVANADGSGRNQLDDQVCKDGRWQIATISWSPLGDRIGVLCPRVDGEPVLEAYSAADGTSIATVNGVHDYRLSVDGSRIAYQTTSAGSTPPPQVRVAGLSGGDTLIADDAILLDWTLTGRLLLGQNPEANPPTYSAVWYDPGSGATSPAPELDNGKPFWIAFDGKTAVVGSKPSTRKDNTGFALAVLNLGTGGRVPINGTIEFPNDTIPGRAVAINAYEAANQFFWVDSQDGQTMTVSSADLRGTRVSYLGTLKGQLVDLSWDGLLLYTPASNTGALVIRDLISGAETQLSDTRIGAIRPPQPDDPRH